jgi:hypothetical protein
MPCAFKTILKGFNKTLTKLDTLVKKNGEAINTNSRQIQTLRSDTSKRLVESNAARNVAENIRGLLGVKES